MTDSVDNSTNNVLQRVKVVSEQIADDIRDIRLSLQHPQKVDQEIGYFQMKDFGKFVYFAGMHTDEEFRGQGVARSFLAKAQGYLEGGNKFGFVSNQVNRNGARDIYGPPDWLLLTQHNWMIYIPKKLRNLEQPLHIPLLDTELNGMVATCMKN